MTEIIHTPKEQSKRDLEAGDIFQVDDHYLKILAVEGDSGNFMLYDIETDTIVASKISHPVHAINWVKKHHGYFDIIYKEQVSLNIEE